MTDQVVSKNIGALITVRNGSTSLAWTSGTTGDGTTKYGISIDREGIAGDSGALPNSGVFGVLWEATLASAASLTISVGVQDSANNSDWADYATAASQTVASGTSGGSIIAGQTNLNVNLSSARRYIRSKFLPTLTRGGTDTGIARSVDVLAGFDRLPSAA